jgi:hypothetical protein
MIQNVFEAENILLWKANGSQIYEPLKAKGWSDGKQTFLKYALLFMYFRGQEIIGGK